MDLGLKGKTALITGASKGIGAGVAEVLAAEGCDLHLASRTAGDLDALKARLEKAHGVTVITHAVDLAVSDNQADLTATCAGVDILINNAGAIPGGDLDAMDEARWREAWDLKVFGYINVTRKIYAAMRKRAQSSGNGGTIVNVIGVAGEHYIFDYVAGTTGNAALMAFTKALGGRSLEDGIRVLAVNPGMVETGRMVTLLRTKAEADLGDPERWQEYTKTLPLGRAATVPEVADVVAFLASDRASYLSGIVVPVDGGKSVRGGLF